MAGRTRRPTANGGKAWTREDFQFLKARWDTRWDTLGGTCEALGRTPAAITQRISMMQDRGLTPDHILAALDNDPTLIGPSGGIVARVWDAAVALRDGPPAPEPEPIPEPEPLTPKQVLEMHSRALARIEDLARDALDALDVKEQKLDRIVTRVEAIYTDGAGAAGQMALDKTLDRILERLDVHAERLARIDSYVAQVCRELGVKA